MNKQKNRSLFKTALIGSLLVLALNLAVAPAVMANVASNESIIGIVDETDLGYVIMVENDGYEDYIVVGYDLSEMVGLTVKVTGMVILGDNGKEVHATSVEEIPE